MELAGMEAGPSASFARKVMGTGAVQPAVHAMNLVEPWLDDRQGPLLDSVRAFTGARVRSVDEDTALRMSLENALRENPRIKQYTGYYKASEDEDTNQLMAEYNATKRKIQEKRKAEKAAAGNTVQ
jgi:hypothetical protein